MACAAAEHQERRPRSAPSPPRWVTALVVRGTTVHGSVDTGTVHSSLPIAPEATSPTGTVPLPGPRDRRDRCPGAHCDQRPLPLNRPQEVAARPQEQLRLSVYSVVIEDLGFASLQLPQKGAPESHTALTMPSDHRPIVSKSVLTQAWAAGIAPIPQ
jgi:hypothetical protein